MAEYRDHHPESAVPLLPAFAAPGRFFKGNLHTHSTRSDAVREPEHVCATYREAGYDFLALTDHFLARYGFPITDTRPFRTNAFTTILGAEVHTGRTATGEKWHILAAGLPLDFAPTPPEETAPELARRCADSGAFVAIAHPQWYALGVDEAETLLPWAHAVEVYNHGSAVGSDRGDGWALMDALLMRGHRLHACATDDAHFKYPDWCGGWTMVKAEAPEPEALVAALRAGHCYSSQGPAIHAIDVTGDEVHVACSPARSVTVLGRGRLDAVVFGDDISEARLNLAKFHEGGWARVVVTDTAGQRAWSNPFWFD
jgi:hypothetical protein